MSSAGPDADDAVLDRIPSADLLDAVSANVALVNGEGQVVAVNRAWRQFADGNSLSWPDYGVGHDYLAICDCSTGSSADGASETAAGIRALLARERATFEVRYPCHGPDDERWFLLRGSRIEAGGQVFVLLSHNEITAEWRARRHLTLDEERLDALNAFLQLDERAERELAERAIEEAARLTGSTIGYLHFVTADETRVELFAWTEAVRNGCSAESDGHYPLSDAGVWADCVRLRVPVVHNDFENLPDRHGYPEGHSHIVRHMSVPVFDGRQIVAVAGVGNKATPYDRADVRQLQLFMSSTWVLIKRLRVEEELRSANQLLETRVAERTADLEASVDALRFAAEDLAALTGAEFFNSLLEHLAHALRADCVLVATLSPDMLSATTVAVLADGRPADGFSYELSGTPCQEVALRGVCAYPSGVQDLFPEDTILAEMGVEAYIGTPLNDHSGRPVGILAALSRSERKRWLNAAVAMFRIYAARATAELIRIQSERVMQVKDRAIDASMSAVAMADLNGRLTYVNDALLNMWGYERPDQVLGRDATEFWGDPEAAARVWDTVVAAGTWAGELTGRRADGSSFVARLTANQVTDHDGRPLCLMASFLDETERRRTEDALRASEARYRSIVQSSPTAMLVYQLEPDGALILVDANPAACRTLGIDTGVYAGLTIEQAFPPLAATEIPERYREVARGGPPWHTDGVEYDDGTIRGTYAVDAFRIELDTLVVAFTDITARRRAEATIIAQNEFLNTVIESLTHPFYVIDVADHSIRLANSAALGDRPREGATCYRISHGRDEPCRGTDHPCPLQEVTRTGKAVTMMHEHLGPGGRPRFVEVHGYPVLDAEGRVTQLIEYAIDVTERTRAQQELRRRNRELTLLNWVMAAATADLEPAAVLETACRELALTLGVPQAVAALIDRGQDHAEVVSEFVAPGRPSVLGYSISLEDTPALAELVAHPMPAVIERAETDPRLENLRDLVRRAEVQSLLIAPLVVDGLVVGGLLLASPERRSFSTDEVSLVLNVAGQAAGSLARARLTESQRRLQTAIEQSPDSVVITDTEARIVYVNPAFETVTGYRQAEVLGANPRLLKSGVHDDRFYADLWATLTAGEIWRGRFTNQRRDGSQFIEDAVITPIRNDRGETVNYVAVKRDVTRMVHMEESFRQAQRLESIGRLAGGIAHDFNNLLAAILGNAELALFSLPDGHQIRGDLEQIEETAERAAGLTQQLLTFARQQIVEPQVLDLNQLILGMDSMVRRLIGEDVELITLPQPKVGKIVADRAQVEQVVLNLVVNGRDAMPDGGRLEVATVDLTVTADSHPHWPEVPPGEYVVLRVADTGEGIPEEFRPHLFEPFFTTKEPGKGTGLGLATCFGIVTAAGGHILVESSPGAGSVFNILWPRAENQARPRDHDSGPHPALEGHETVLVVEDEANVRAVIVKTLEAHGYRVLEASNGEEALRLFAAAEEPIDLLITDLVMPRMGGRELVEAVRTEKPGMKRIYMSGYVGERSMAAVEADRAAIFLQKPFSIKTLATKVREALDG